MNFSLRTAFPVPHKSCYVVFPFSLFFSMGFPGQEYWSRWPFPPPGDLIVMEKFHIAQKLHWLMLSLQLTYNKRNKTCQFCNLNFSLIHTPSLHTYCNNHC